ncbi:v-type proton atpase subunit h [Anaeramoeba ignava]|uniref:V-type proton atpase subunit h n=1 Tax=Anaeramoeba ignava TaxID=1746090 RepID=A0A9Q0RCD6_ANAIG|nr:v-type proton atpase subunit h [Anaeramoeba ignava]
MRLLLNHLNNYQEIADIISDIYKVFIKNFDFEKETPVLRLIKLLMSEKSNSVDLLLLFVNEMESKISNANPKSSKIESNVASSFVLSFSSLLLLETSLLVENIEKIREFITSSLFIRNVIRKSENIMFTLLRTLKNTLKNELIIHLLKIIQSLFEDDPNIDFFRLHEERFFHSLCLDLMALVQENKQEAIQKQATQILRLIISHFAKQKNTQFLHSLVRILLRRENIDIEFMELIIHFFGLIQLNNFWKDFMLKNLQFLPRYSQNKMRLLSLIAKYKPEDLPNIHLLDQEFISQIGINNDFVVSSFEFLDNCIDSRIDIVENNIDLLLLVSQSPKKVVISDVIRGFAETILNEFQKKKDINKK